MNITYALGKGTYLSNRYRIDEIIGQGGFGITYVAYDEAEGKKCAVKEYFPRDSAVRLSNGKEVKTVSDEKIEIFNHGLTRFMEEADVLWKLQGVDPAGGFAAAVSLYPRGAKADAESAAAKPCRCGAGFRPCAGNAALHPHHPHPAAGKLHGKSL